MGVEIDKPPVSASKLYQDSSGGVNWNSANHVDKDMKVPTRFRGYRVFRGLKKISEGYRADAWLHARSAAGSVAVGVRDFWQNFPKALELKGSTLRIGLWPREFAIAHELLGGEQKTHEMLFVFAPPKTADQAIERRMKAFQRPLYAMPDPAAIYATRTVWPTGSRLTMRFMWRAKSTMMPEPTVCPERPEPPPRAVRGMPLSAA